jgi:hypothetical protein
LFAKDQRLERVLAFLADVLKDGHEENSAKKTAAFYLKSKRGTSQTHEETRSALV